MTRALLTTLFLLFFCSSSYAFTSTTTEEQLGPSVRKYTPLFCKDVGEMDARLLVNYYKQDKQIVSRHKNVFENQMDFPKLSSPCLKHRKQYIDGFRTGFSKSLTMRTDSNTVKCFKHLRNVRESEIEYIFQSLYKYNPNSLATDAKYDKLQMSLKTFSQKCKNYDKTDNVILKIQEEIKSLR